MHRTLLVALLAALSLAVPSGVLASHTTRGLSTLKNDLRFEKKLLAAKKPGRASHTTLRLSALKNGLRFNKKLLVAKKPGKVTLVMVNHSPLPHDIALKGHGIDVKGKTVRKGGISRITVVLKRGRYEFYCAVPGHEQAGMKGWLIVR